MNKIFLVKVELPEWGVTPQQEEWIRCEIEQHAGAAAAYYTRAVKVTVRCEVAGDKIGAMDRLNAMETPR